MRKKKKPIDPGKPLSSLLPPPLTRYFSTEIKSEDRKIKDPFQKSKADLEELITAITTQVPVCQKKKN